MISSSANRFMNFRRRSAFVLAATTAAATLTPSVSLRLTSYVEITVAGGTTGSGTVDVVGTDDSGASQSETLTFSSNGVQQTVKRFATVTEITTTGLADEATVATVQARAISADGTPNIMFETMASDQPVIFQLYGGGAWMTQTQGTHVGGTGIVVFDYDGTWTPRVGDLCTDTATDEEWQVREVQQVRIGYGVRPHHWRLAVERYDM